jgi:hypothetical protein
MEVSASKSMLKTVQSMVRTGSIEAVCVNNMLKNLLIIVENRAVSWIDGATLKGMFLFLHF